MIQNAVKWNDVNIVPDSNVHTSSTEPAQLLFG
jgi:hypothetical protein